MTPKAPVYIQQQAFMAPNLIYASKDGKSQDNFKNSIISLVMFTDMRPFCSFTMTFLCEKFNIQRRRLYDVINVFEAIGICQKTSVDTVMWIGRQAVASYINKMKEKINKNCSNKDLNISSNEKCITISHLTTSFIMNFIVQNTSTVDIKCVAEKLSKDNNRFKTTLCKLYQISHILEAAQILEKTTVPGETAISKYFFVPDQNKPVAVQKSVIDNSYNVENLLNRPIANLSSHPICICA